MRAWLISNLASGSTDAETLDRLPALFPALDFVGHSRFPDEPLPPVAALRGRSVSLIVLLAGDGTINAAATLYDSWEGAALILPGGTMNMLAQLLHGPSTVGDIAAAIGRGDAVRETLCYVAAEDRRAYVGAIAGPAGLWAHAREAVRQGRFRSAWRAARLAWLRRFARGPRLRGQGRTRTAAVLLLPIAGAMEIACIDVAGWMDAARLGFDYLRSDWRRSAAVEISEATEATLDGRRSVHMLFDGEAARMRLPLTLRHGRSRLAFLATRARDDSGRAEDAQAA
ncbi:MAG: hypothetical protein KAY22_11855 [Rhizorhabdus sp.]|uniref:diacylglycerol/lipid kinase family protein n=1 Tax=Rhizorhabdus sp. TaxID=1968843 RepID=UPI001B4A5986|nr:diacylglycerol kinase family protein [Rhizorhabdus sp.]MBP8232991.1 hypothetical protein [Rhizorhabdus sp.]